MVKIIFASFVVLFSWGNAVSQCRYVVPESVVTVVVTRNKTDRPPCNPLHDEVLAGLQVLDDIFAQSWVSLDEALDDFVEVEGSQVDHIQYPGETHV